MNEVKKLYIIRGIPGSGKSTLAYKLTNNVVEADQYMYVNDVYQWSGDKLHKAHQWCQNTVKKYLQEGRDIIAVANTFVKKKEYEPYIQLANEYNYDVSIIVCNGEYESIHNVPSESIERMKRRFEN